MIGFLAFGLCCGIVGLGIGAVLGQDFEARLWREKAQVGIRMASGGHFYIIKREGTDGIHIDEEGTTHLS